MRQATITPSSRQFYTLRSGSFDIYSAALPTGEEAVTPLRLSPRAVDTNRTPVWSSDGQRLAYISMRGPYSGDGAMRLVIQNLADQRECEFPLDIPANLTRLAWSADDTRLALRTRLGRQFGVHLLDVDTGKILGVLRGPVPRNLTIEDEITDIGWVDSNTINYASARGLHALDVPSGRHRSILEVPAGFWVHGMSLDPAQREAALVVSDDDDLSAFTWFAIWVADLTGGAPRETYRVDPPDYLWIQTWARDGIYVTPADSSVPLAQRRSQLWRVSPADGTATRLATPIERLEELRVHPDGSRVAFTSSSQRTEFWMTTYR